MPRLLLCFILFSCFTQTGIATDRQASEKIKNFVLTDMQGSPTKQERHDLSAPSKRPTTNTKLQSASSLATTKLIIRQNQPAKQAQSPRLRIVQKMSVVN